MPLMGYKLRRHWYWIPAASLLLVSWYIAQWPIMPPPQLDANGVGQRILVGGALPWYLQWSGLAVVVVVGVCGRFGCDREITLGAVLVPLLVGSVWWLGLAWVHWSQDPLELVSESVIRAYRHEYGAESLMEFVLFRIIGPLTCPMMLGGPFHLESWAFVLTLVSTSLIIVWGLWAGRRLRAGKPTIRTYALLASVYASPAIVLVMLDFFPAFVPR